LLLLLPHISFQPSAVSFQLKAHPWDHLFYLNNWRKWRHWHGESRDFELN